MAPLPAGTPILASEPGAALPPGVALRARAATASRADAASSAAASSAAASSTAASSASASAQSAAERPAWKLRPNERVRICDGPLEGLVGRVVALRPKDRVPLVRLEGGAEQQEQRLVAIAARKLQPAPEETDGNQTEPQVDSRRRRVL